MITKSKLPHCLMAPYPSNNEKFLILQSRWCELPDLSTNATALTQVSQISALGTHLPVWKTADISEPQVLTNEQKFNFQSIYSV